MWSRNKIGFSLAAVRSGVSAKGAAFACRSPFSDGSKPSFFVRLVKGYWQFKDFSSGAGGTIFDFVRMKEGLGSFTEALSFVQRLLSGALMCDSSKHELKSAARRACMASIMLNPANRTACMTSRDRGASI
jgi:hypothetical protein